MKKLRKDFPSLTEAVEAQAVANLATVDAIENSDHNKKATDKEKEKATKTVDKFVNGEDKMVEKSEKESKKLTESFDDDIFSNLYVDLISLDGVEGNLHTKFDEKGKDVDHQYITVDIDDTVDLDGIYDVINRYKDSVEIEELPDVVKFHITSPKSGAGIPRDLFDEIMTQLTNRGENVRIGGKPVMDRGAGYNFENQISSLEHKDGIIVTIDSSKEGYVKNYLADLTPAIKIAKKYADLGVAYKIETEIDDKPPFAVKQYLTIEIPEDAKAAFRDDRFFNKEKNESCKRKLTESGTDVLYDLIDRAKGWVDDGDSPEDAVEHAIDDGLIYTEDICDLAMKYGVIDEGQLISDMYDDLYSDMLKEVAEYAEERNSDDDIEESVRTKKTLGVC